ncbi:hypothetical protein HB770_04020 [Rhizobium leguminosarum bv. viciae]|uniref:Uncharacterized protein n=1 Tax=Rhizobium leguminosarum bv. viciae TaxID=387 RepID=A0A7G6RHT1_RHILV|nr:hypothetical protein HB770_04020 [Rhizobium leguminosarum bv. viciae]
MKEDLAEAIKQRLLEDESCHDIVRKTMKSSRPRNLQDFIDGDGALYGMVRLTQLAEALGMRPEVTFRQRAA